LKYVVDTHALLWYLDGNPSLGSTTNAILSDPRAFLVLPAAAYAEACWICQSARRVTLSLGQLMTSVNADSRTFHAPLNKSVVERSNTLQVIGEMHDRKIVATTLLIIEAGEATALITADENITHAAVVPPVS
jgi:PIN domain nuclease of toxin-antitoxin system